jgi:hypothetical protein
VIGAGGGRQAGPLTAPIRILGAPSHHRPTPVALHAQRQGSLQIGWQQVGGAEAAWLQIGWQ